MQLRTSSNPAEYITLPAAGTSAVHLLQLPIFMARLCEILRVLFRFIENKCFYGTKWPYDGKCNKKDQITGVTLNNVLFLKDFGVKLS
jgi:hypothetical protein